MVIVWDSIGGAPTEEEIANPKTQQPGVAARALRRACRQLMGKVARSGALFLLVNQQYEKIGFTGFGAKKSTYGGGGIRYHATMRLELVRTGALKDARDNAVGIECLCRVFKNSMASPRDEAFAIEWGRGINNAWSLLEKLKAHRYVVAGGGWYRFQVQGGEPAQWQGGWKGLDALLQAHPELLLQMRTIYDSLPPGGR
jgi:RecA/RadA recombinase